MSEQLPPRPMPHPYPGKLIIVEGIDGSGKSTQLQLLQKWLESQGHKVFFTEWNSSELVKDTTKKGKKSKSLTPTTFSLLHATDFATRLYHEILPPLKAGMLVLADRYMYTAFARDVVRGVSRGGDQRSSPATHHRYHRQAVRAEGDCRSGQRAHVAHR